MHARAANHATIPGIAEPPSSPTSARVHMAVWLGILPLQTFSQIRASKLVGSSIGLLRAPADSAHNKTRGEKNKGPHIFFHTCSSCSASQHSCCQAYPRSRPSMVATISLCSNNKRMTTMSLMGCSTLRLPTRRLPTRRRPSRRLPTHLHRTHHHHRTLHRHRCRPPRRRIPRLR